MLSGYLKVLSGSNTKVGIAEGIQGACQVTAAFPAGWLADRYRRDRVLKYSAVLGQVAVVLILLALFSGDLLGLFSRDETEKTQTRFDSTLVEYVLLCIGLGIWGTFCGASNAPLEALFADSTDTANRPRVCFIYFLASWFFFISLHS